MKVLALSNLYPPDMIGGYELGCFQAVGALRRRGHEVEVVTSAPRLPVPPEPQVRRVLKLTDIYNVHVNGHAAPITRRLMNAESSFVSSFNVHSLGMAVEDIEPDVAYLWNIVGLGGLSLLLTLQHLGVPWVWHLMDPVPHFLCSLDGHIIPPVAREFERQARGSYIGCSQRVLDEVELGGVRLHGEKEVVPNWIDGEAPGPRQRRFDGGHLRIAFAGQVARHKGIHILIEAAALLRREGYGNFSIDVFGDGSDPTLAGMVQEYGLENCIRFEGFRAPTELSALYAEYDMFVFPTWQREPFGFAPLEAGAQGCVPLVTDDCGFSEWFVDGVDCLKAPRTAEAFAGRLRDVLDGRIDLEPIGRRAMQVVWRDYHLDTVIKRVEDALERASKQSRERAGSADEAYHLALMAEKLLFVLLHENA